MKPALLWILLAAAAFHLHAAAENSPAPEPPGEMLPVRAAYQQQLDSAIAPIKAKYAELLDSMKKTYGAKGDLNAALQVQAEIDQLAAPPKPAAPVSPPAATSTVPADLAATRAAFQQRIKTAADPIRAKYAGYLDALKKTYGARGDVNAALAIQMEINSLDFLPPPNSAAQDTVVIWNQNNGGKGDRGAKTINLVLLHRGREAWRKNAIPLGWHPSDPVKDEISVPSIPADKLRIELAEVVNHRGGLAEVEYLRSGINLARGRPVTVSSTWESNPKFDSSKLTDGSPATFWLSIDKETGWAEIALSAAP